MAPTTTTSWMAPTTTTSTCPKRKGCERYHWPHIYEFDTKKKPISFIVEIDRSNLDLLWKDLEDFETELPAYLSIEDCEDPLDRIKFGIRQKKGQPLTKGGTKKLSYKFNLNRVCTCALSYHLICLRTDHGLLSLLISPPPLSTKMNVKVVTAGTKSRR